MKSKVNDFLDLFGDLHAQHESAQVILLVYFHAVEEGRESVNSGELEHLFNLADLPIPRNLPQLLGYLCGPGAKLINNGGEYRLRREARKELDNQVRKLRGEVIPPKIEPVTTLEFPDRTFTDKKIATLLDELRKCYRLECWNAAGLLIRIIIERTLDSVNDDIKAKNGLKDKINKAREAKISKSLKDGLDHLMGAKLVGDIAAHHSKVLLDRGDIDVTLNPFRILLKEVTSV